MPEKLISELIILPDRVRKGDFVLNLSKGVTEPEKTLEQYVVTPQLAASFDDALDFIRSAVESLSSKACYLHGSFGSGKSHFMAVLHLMLEHYPKPDWWVAKPAPTSQQEEVAPPTLILGPKRPPTLFDKLRDEERQPKAEEKPVKPEQPRAMTGWVEKFLASQAYKEQREFVKRHAPDDETIRRSLVVLDSSGGILTPVAFCKATDLPAGRLDGLMARMQRVLNVDSYEVLIFSRAENRIELNIAKLKRQFDLE